MSSKYCINVIILICLLLKLLDGYDVPDNLAIRHRRARLRSRRHSNHNKLQMFSSDFENLGSINGYSTSKPSVSDNLTITTMDEQIIVSLPGKNTKTHKNDKPPVQPGSDEKINVKVNSNIHSNNSWKHIDKTVLYMGEERVLNKMDHNENNTQSELLQNANINRSSNSDSRKSSEKSGHADIVTRFLRIVESQHLLGENCTAGTDLNLGEGVVDRYAQDRFRIEADIAVNRANMLTRVWKYADTAVHKSRYLLYASVYSLVEFNDVIFGAGNCYDKHQFKDYFLFCPYAYRLPEGGILVKDLAVEYKYLSNTSEWFYVARKNAEKVIKNNNQFTRGKYYLLR